jgi:hypothetical protein
MFKANVVAGVVSAAPRLRANVPAAPEPDSEIVRLLRAEELIVEAP